MHGVDDCGIGVDGGAGGLQETDIEGYVVANNLVGDTVEDAADLFHIGIDSGQVFHVIRGNVVHRLGFRPLLLVFRLEPLIEEKPSIGIYDSERQNFVALLGMQAGGLCIEVDAVGIVAAHGYFTSLSFAISFLSTFRSASRRPDDSLALQVFSETLLFLDGSFLQVPT